ncbi:hypothetical protein EAF04_000389 [Stromatinia cepivora]|nr:hypothetical protein EAF04_000389 [Stromatinia cepivora]
MASRSKVVREESLAPASAHDLERKKKDESGRNEMEKDGKEYLSHIERTAAEPRDESLHTLLLTSITPINPTTRLFYLSPRSSSPSPSTSSKSTSTSTSTSTTTSTPANLLTWKPGQWIDLYLPGIEKPGGFSITNIPPSTSSSSPTSFHSQTSSRNKNEVEEAIIELAIQKPTKQEKISEQVFWLFQPPSSILNQEVKVRIGGSFTLPPSFPFFSSSPSSSNPPPSSSTKICSGNTTQTEILKDQFESTNFKGERGRDIKTKTEKEIKRIIFIAGGMGVNPLMSMLSYIHAEVERISESNAEKIACSNDQGDEGMSGMERTIRKDRCLENLEVKFLYSTKAPSPIGEGEKREEIDGRQILFLPRLTSIFAARKNWEFQLFVTGINTSSHCIPSSFRSPPSPPLNNITPHPCRISPHDIHLSLSLSLPPKTKDQKQDQKQTIIYTCGPPTMTDEIISYIRDIEGMSEERVVCERWW